MCPKIRCDGWKIFRWVTKAKKKCQKRDSSTTATAADNQWTACKIAIQLDNSNRTGEPSNPSTTTFIDSAQGWLLSVGERGRGDGPRARYGGVTMAGVAFRRNAIPLDSASRHVLSYPSGAAAPQRENYQHFSLPYNSEMFFFYFLLVKLQFPAQLKQFVLFCTDNLGGTFFFSYLQ